MKKKSLGLLAVFVFGAPVFAEDYPSAEDYHHVYSTSSFYVRADAGAAILHAKRNEPNLYTKHGGVVSSIGIGYAFNPNIRSDIFFQYSRFTVDSGNIKSGTALWNLYYDFDNETILTPYLCAGLGYSKVNTESNKTSFIVQDGRVTWDVGLGLKVMLLKHVDVDFGYKFGNLGQTINSSVAYVQQFTGGIIYKF